VLGGVAHRGQHADSRAVQERNLGKVHINN
jgi:hypothetical protein